MYCEIIEHRNGFSSQIVDDEADRVYADEVRVTSREACISRIIVRMGTRVQIFDRIDPIQP